MLSRLPAVPVRVAIPLVTFAFAVAMMSTTLPTPLYPIYEGDFGFGTFTVTAVFATYAVGVIAALVSFGHASDEIGRRRVLALGLALAIASAIVFLLADGTGVLFAGRILSGLSAGLFTGTATAYLADLYGERRTQAALVATAANIGGLGLGPLLSGAIAQWSDSPLRLPYWIDLALLALAAAGLALSPETVAGHGSARLRLQRLTVPEHVRSVFITATVGGFAGFAILGLFTAVAPGFLGEVLGVSSHLAAGALVFSIFASSAVAQVALFRLPADRALRAGLVALIAGLALIVLALAVETLPPLVVGAVVAGAGQGLTFRGGMASIAAELEPAGRAAVISTFFVVLYTAISLPVVGVGLLAQLTDLQTAAITLSLVAAGLAVASLRRLVTLQSASARPG